MSRLRLRLLLAALAWAWTVVGLGAASAEGGNAVADFYHGKTIRLVVPSGPGGAYGVYALLFSKYFGLHVPGAPTVVPEYRAGAGGLIAANYLYTLAPKDGTVIGIPLAPLILGQYTGGSAVQYNAAKYLWIGQLADITRLLTVWSDSKIKKFSDLKTYPSIAGTTGNGSETFINPAVINHVFGTRIKIIGGYKGSAALLLALERGEINLVSATYSNFAANHSDWIRQNKVRFLVQIGLSKLSRFPDVPLLADLAPNEQDRQLIEFMSLVTTSIGYSVMAPPGVPDNIMAALRKAFDETTKDPAFIADAEKRHIDLVPKDYKYVQSAAEKAINSPPALFQRFIHAIGGS